MSVDNSICIPPYLHVSQVLVEQVVQALEELLRRLLSPPMPNEEKSF